MLGIELVGLGYISLGPRVRDGSVFGPRANIVRPCSHLRESTRGQRVGPLQNLTERGVRCRRQLALSRLTDRLMGGRIPGTSRNRNEEHKKRRQGTQRGHSGTSVGG